MKKDISLFAAHTAEKTNTDGIWYFDSGCSRHMTGSIEFLTNLQKETGGQVTFGDGGKGYVIGGGDLNVQGLPKLRDVLLVDGLIANLISISQLCDQNLYVNFTIDGCKCQYNRENTAQLWHKRLGHIHSRGLQKLIKYGAVRGLPTLTGTVETVYKGCMEGKQHRTPHPPWKIITTKQPLKLLHIDLMGIVQTESIAGKKYVMVCVDDFTKFTWVESLSEKSKVLVHRSRIGCFMTKLRFDQDERAWRSVEDGWEPPTVEVREGADKKRILKSSAEWNDVEERLANCNSKALNAIFGGIDEEQFRRVSACTTAKEAWKILEVHYEGTESVRAIKLQMLMTQFELMRMRDDETILEFEGKIRDIANQFANLGDRIPQDRLVKKVLCSLSSKFKMKRIAIEENRSLNDMTLDELIGSLKTFEMNEDSSNSVREVKKDSVALQTRASNEVTQSTQESDIPTITLAELDAKVSFLAKGFNKYIRKSKKKNFSSGDGKLREGGF
ncbi:hypothetical protein H6P81_012507 [Aristolochia fimbriata]|uniref:GAG-pre-integrase domain-containing protein n=1 Tax=Aristolochia fimbriata TaxID=158543 RepID=A0AAV7EDK6_ARIFI|nr:hypothetical protein H6P81_012507 [Aristolochia fimbriata]